MNKVTEASKLRELLAACDEVLVYKYRPGLGTGITGYVHVEPDILRPLLEAALSAKEEAEPGAVKPLVWTKHPNATAWRCDTIVGRYQVFAVMGDPSWTLDGLPGQNASGYVDTAFGAKAAAQADYEARIRSALTPTPAKSATVQAKEDALAEVTHRCTSMRLAEGEFSGGRREPCQGVLMSNGEWRNTCGEPCRWIMRKSGEGQPPFGEAPADVSLIKYVERLQAIIDWADLALANPTEFNAHGVKNLTGPVFDAARAALSPFPLTGEKP
jgi:hypothetical protein